MELKGEYKNKTEKYKNPDILYSTLSIYPEKFLKNIFNISIKNDKIYVYHSYNNIHNNISGRWYDGDLKKYKYENGIFEYIIPEYEDETNGFKILKNVKVKIYFTEKGKKILDKILKK